MILCISVVLFVTSPFSFLILLFYTLFFKLMNLAKILLILFFSSKNQILVSLIFSMVFLDSISFLFDLYDIFPFTNFGFCSFFFFYFL